MKLLHILLCLLIPLAQTFAEDSPTKKDPIDMAMDAAMDKDPSTAGMVKAISDANTKWDKRMNDAFQNLKKTMQPDEWHYLVLAQKDWLVYREAQLKSINVTFSKMDGTMWIPVSASKAMEITKERALFLESLVDTIGER
ncbi:MAG TPA: lysozyme inhibitor LprI family protein [Chthoniobacterales bacterium]